MTDSQWIYMDEGNANVIYWSPSNPRLLRIPKHVSAKTVYEFHSRNVTPRLGRWATEMLLKDDDALLVESACPRDLLAQCLQAKKQFPVACRSAWIQNSCRVAIEFKPKWLMQSPRAPSNALSCRTCAMNRHRGRNGFCPLILGSSDPQKAVNSLLCAASKALSPVNLASHNLGPLICVFLTQNRPFDCLFEMQALDKPGASSHDLALAMTARDCSAMMTLEIAANPQVSLKFFDLDPKTDVQSWSRKEAALDYLTYHPDCLLSSAS